MTEPIELSSSSEEPDSQDGCEEPSTSWSRLDLYLIGAVTLLAGVLRLLRLGEPDRQVFDEGFYAKDACYYALNLEAECGLQGTIIEVHPPMGKWVIAAGIKLFGFNSFGTRIMVALAGIATVALVYLLARAVLKSSAGAVVASGALSLDPLHFVHSRTAMFEAPLTFFVVLAFLALVYDHRARARAPDRASPAWRPWLACTGLAVGAATSTKWSGAAVGLAVVIGLLLLARSRREARAPSSFLSMIRGELVPVGIYLVALPVALYLVSYIGTFPSVPGGPWVGGEWFQALWDQHVLMVDYFRNPRAPHLYQSSPLLWLVALEAFPYAVAQYSDQFAEIMAVINPLTVWPGLLGLVYLAVRYVRHIGDRALLVVALLGFAATYLVWVGPALTGYNSAFVYYAVPALPFLFIGLGGIASWLQERSRLGQHALIAYAVAVLAFFAFIYPLLAHVFLSPMQWRVRVDLYNACPIHDRDLNAFQVTQLLREQCERSGGNN